MQKFRSLSILLTIIFLMGIVGTAAAQDGTVENFTFQSEAEWLEDPYFALMGGATNVRAIPTQNGNIELFTAPAGTTVEVVAQYNSRDWLLGRFWNRQGTYIGHGWFNTAVANLNRNVTVEDEDALPTCPQTNGGVQLDVRVRFNTGWVHDTMSTGCTLIYEGRLEVIERHDYWIIRDSNAAATQTVTTTHYLTNGFMWLLEGTGWAYPTTWNMGRGISNGDTGQEMEFPPMVSYLAMDKQEVMRENDYEYPFRVNLLNGNFVDFPFGAFGDEPNSVDRCDFSAPETMELTGIYNSSSRTFVSTSVGAVGCRTVILWRTSEGYQLLGFTGSRERLEYRTIYAAVLMPSAWDSQRVQDYVMDEIIPDANLPRGTVVENDGVDGLPASITIQ